MGEAMFEHRTDAGRRLAAVVRERASDADIVLAIPRGGLPVAHPVAAELDVPLSVVVARKLGAPNNPELAIGAVAPDGSRWLHEDLVKRLGVDEAYIDRIAREEAENAREKEERYLGGDEPPLDGATVVLVDDGVATGATAHACIDRLRSVGAHRIVLAVPVGPPESLERFEREVDEVIALSRPAAFGAVGSHYRSFEQVSDDEALQYLDR